MLRSKKPAFRSRKPQAAGAVLEKTFGQLHISKDLERYQAFPHWPKIVGEDIARISIPERIVAGNQLVVRVLDASWVQELSLRKEEIIDKIFEAGIGAVIEDVRFVTGNPKNFRSR